MPCAAWGSFNLILSLLVASTSFFLSTLFFFIWRWKNVRRSLRIATKTSFGNFTQIFLLVFAPIFLLIYLLQSGQIQILIYGSLVLVASILALEVLFRIFGLDCSYASSYRPRNGQNGTQVERTEAHFASDMYPRDYMSEDFYRRIQYDARRSQAKEKVDKSQGVQFGRCRAYKSPDYNVVNGLRFTTDIPERPNRNCLVFGTSQIFGEEVPDDLTCTSFLQRLLNEDENDTRVVNQSLPASFAVERANFLITNIPTQPGDILIFIFGSNDCGMKVGEFLSNESKMSPLMVLLTKFIKLRSVLFNELFKKIVCRHILSCGEVSIGQTKTALEEVCQFAIARKLHLLIVLQPTIYTSKRFSEYENKLLMRFSTILEQQIQYAYPRFTEWSKSNLSVISLTRMFDQTSEVVFLDWVHLNARGHELLAKRLFDEIRSKANR
jgi:lysophospholipase L1-like esterase